MSCDAWAYGLALAHLTMSVNCWSTSAAQLLNLCLLCALSGCSLEMEVCMPAIDLRSAPGTCHQEQPSEVCLCMLQKQQALLGQMLMEGYGCERDAAAGKEWSDKARRRGYRMAGVYCEL